MNIKICPRCRDRLYRELGGVWLCVICGYEYYGEIEEGSLVNRPDLRQSWDDLWRYYEQVLQARR